MESEKEFYTAKIKFTRKVSKMGRTYIFVIPKNYIDEGLIELDQEYEVYLVKKEIKEEKGKQKKT